MAISSAFPAPTLPVAVIGLLLVLLSPKIIGWTGTNRSSLLRALKLSKRTTTEIVSLRIYPIKSCRGLQLSKTNIRLHGLDLDRQWMFVDAKTHEFLTIRQLPQMTLINTALSDNDNAGDAGSSTLILSITGAPAHDTVRIPARPDQAWLAAHTMLSQVKIWDTQTDGYIYGAAVNAPFSKFLGRAVCLVYKGPTPRILQGNGDPRLLGREQSTFFPDVHPVLIASEASLAELNARLCGNGAAPITIERFRPNIIVRGGAAWSEDSWKVVRIASGEAEGSAPGALELDVVARCARCQVPNVDPDTAVKDRREPWDTLMAYRRVDEGMKYKPCFGMLSAPRREGVVAVGMKLEVVEETTQHRYIKGF
ncbi:MOSC domain-containing protein [Aspergillus clavatus NRRL 1]|uniref:MOSC domain n=1 Tax=Aspergillus clavatus (strain ATCC 1007 / CBS 513.65 / DSM 816 / NCTC 3887 / NRRL 1 / QM 1276 / 107) TaxID=344612 RepID=A1CTC2_ASPCL|nr:MOSC domain [Aspergillus clavatus NRRL 1]EAW06559.1 MOSC domain [Aspergillus clavatus NRRL 1]